MIRISLVVVRTSYRRILPRVVRVDVVLNLSEDVLFPECFLPSRLVRQSLLVQFLDGLFNRRRLIEYLSSEFKKSGSDPDSVLPTEFAALPALIFGSEFDIGERVCLF